MKLKSGEETTYPETDCHGVLITKSTKSSSAILVNRTVDLVNLSQYKLNIDIICLPYGIKNLPQQILPLFENYEKLIIWFGHDVISVEAAKQFAKKLEEKRCFIVRYVLNFVKDYLEYWIEKDLLMNRATNGCLDSFVVMH